jgi:hypothetical protein
VVKVNAAPGSRENADSAKRMGFWWVDRPWALAESLPSFRASIDDIAEFDMDCWFGDWAEPTYRAVADHARRMAESDLRLLLALDDPPHGPSRGCHRHR